MMKWRWSAVGLTARYIAAGVRHAPQPCRKVNSKKGNFGDFGGINPANPPGNADEGSR
jgi:hypothetical protein